MGTDPKAASRKDFLLLHLGLQSYERLFDKRAAQLNFVLRPKGRVAYGTDDFLGNYYPVGADHLSH